jgi:hypothetical protein
MNRIERKWSMGMISLLTFAFFLLLFGIVGCRFHTEPIIIPPDGGGGSGGTNSSGGQSATGGTSNTGGLSAIGGTLSTSTSTDVCDIAGQRLAILNCPEAKTPDGTPYATFCRHARITHLDIHPECISKITSCSQVNAAYRGCR